MRRLLSCGWVVGLTGAALLAMTAPAVAQPGGGGASLGGGGARLGSGGGGLGSGGLGSGGLGSGGLGSGGSGGFGSGGFGSGGLGSGGSSFGGSSSSGFMGGTPATATGSFRPGTGTGTATNAQIGSTTFMGPYYYNPLAFGMPSGNTSSTAFGSNLTPNTAQVRFGQPLYALTGTTASGLNTLGGPNGTAGITVGNNGANNLGAGIGVRRAPQFVTKLGDEFDAPPAAPPARLRGDLQNLIASSTRFHKNDRIEVVMDGSTVVLRGEVERPSERDLAEGMLRLTPGVEAVRNELKPRKP